MSIYFLTIQDIINLHDKSIERFGGAYGIRDRNLLESAAAQPRIMIFKKYVHKDVYQMAAAYAFHIIKNHAFIDGNKRTGILSALTFLEKNNYSINIDLEKLYELALSIAQSHIKKDAIANLLKQNSKHYKKNN